MILENLKIHNFRCYDSLEFRPDPKFNVIYGDNGQGKTSILEAISLLLFLKSFRNAKNSEMLKVNCEEGALFGDMLSPKSFSAKYSIKLFPKRKLAAINGKSCRYISEYIGKVSSVSFSPNDLEIIRGAPENRRNWVDKVASLIDPTHIDLVATYSKILDHRNKILRDFSQGKKQKISEDFHIWTEQLIELGAKVIHHRIHAVDKSVDKIKNYYDQIAHEPISLKMNYISPLFEKIPQESVLELISQELKNSFEASFQRELVVGSTLVGPHRDDVSFLMEDQQMKSFGSQGEVRSLVLAMRLAEVEIAKQYLNTNSILLIDDFSSELDEKRRKFLLDYLVNSESQIFLTTTEKIEIGKTFFVSNASISRGNENFNGYTENRCE